MNAKKKITKTKFYGSYFKLQFTRKLVFICFYLGLIFPLMAQNRPCRYDEKTLLFTGTPSVQARCLLRPNKIGGVLGEELKSLPKPFEKIIGKEVKIKKENLRSLLRKNNISENALGGSLDEMLSKAKLPNGQEIQALYFIIHDTSSPYLKDEPFPENFDKDVNWRGNNLEIWLKQPVAHVFVNRLGESLTINNFGYEQQFT